jgi:polyketide synthase PksL
MTISAGSLRDFDRIAAAIFRYVEQLGSRPDLPAEHRVLLAGRLPESVEAAFLDRWKDLANRPVCIRAFRYPGELENWRENFEAVAAGVEASVMPIDGELPLTAGAFDLVAILEADVEISRASVSTLKRRLKRNGTLLAATKAGTTKQLKESLVSAGFLGVAARSDRIANSADSLEIDCIVAQSDGRIRVAAPVQSVGPEPVIKSRQMVSPQIENQTSNQTKAMPDRASIHKLITSLVEQMLQLPADALDPLSPFSEYGVDSIGSVVLVNELNRRLGLELKPTILFDYASVDRLTGYLSDYCRPTTVADTVERTQIAIQESAPLKTAQADVPRSSVNKSVAQPLAIRKTDIAVIGISGRFPRAENVRRFWENLVTGKNCITSEPIDRWNPSEDSGSRSVGHSIPKRGGFLSGAAEFDPLFFNISGREAEVTDPQHRLFLGEAYHALEDAGYAGQSTHLAKKCGVFVGVEPGDYLHGLMKSAGHRENAPVFQGNAESILAARIAYFLDLKGPSIAINTACSSSLVAIHLACQSLINGECDLALAGGVRVFASEKAYLALGNMGMLSPDGQCKTFDAQADGFVPGEAVGVLVLKPLQNAVRDEDHIYGVIKGSAINQDGRTNGITAPSSLSQTDLELEVYQKFGLNPETFQYVEAHGTGTKLGDPIEVEALTNAFAKYSTNKAFCGIGSVKTNIGHTMAAAGVSSVIKVLLSLQHSKIPPSLNLEKPNPYIDFEHSPFFVNVETRDWPAVSERPRRAAVSSFGFSGTNSHLVLEETPALEGRRNQLARKPAYLVAISGKSEEALDRQLEQLREWVKEQDLAVDLEQISFTLNAGRGHFEYRSAFVVGSVDELREALDGATLRESGSSSWRSRPNGAEPADEQLFRTLGAALLKDLSTVSREDAQVYREKLNALAALYVRGYDFDALALHTGEAKRRISLPTYPFAHERYWIPLTGPTAISGGSFGQGERRWLHPMLQHSSDSGNEFVSSFSGAEFFFDEHQIRGAKILPGVAYLEMAIAAARQLTNELRLSLNNVTWLLPLAAEQAKRVCIRLSSEGANLRFGVWSGEGDVLHAEGKAISGADSPSQSEDLSQIRARCPRAESADLIYARCAEAGLKLGPSFRTIREIWVGEAEALARLELPIRPESEADKLCLHPGLLDGAFQSIAALVHEPGFGLPVPFAVREVRFGELGSSCYAHIRRSVAENGLLRFDVRLLDERGRVLVELNGVSMRALAPTPSVEDDTLIYLRPAWRNAPSVSVSTPLSGRLLWFDADEASARTIRILCPGLVVVPIVFGASFKQLENGFQVQPGSIEDLGKVLRTGRPDFVVYRWATSSNEIRATIEQSILPLFIFIRELLRQGSAGHTDVLVPCPQDGNPAYTALAGYARTLEQERPNVRLRMIESADCELSAIIRELQDTALDIEIRYANGERQVRASEVFSPKPGNELPIRQEGVYVISGGLGGLGRIFARYLAEVYRARLVLIGRSEVNAERETFLRQLHSLGGESFYLPADVAVSEDLRAVLLTARNRFGPIHGVIHAAGVIQDGFIIQKEDFSTVLGPKVLGAVALDDLTANDPLDFFAMFSSIAGVFGNVGQSDYAYANRFLDEFAHQRERRRRMNERPGVTVSIAWPAWRNGGMRTVEELELRKLAQVGLKPLEDKEGLTIFEAALRAGEPEVVGLFGHKEKVDLLIAPSKQAPQTAANQADRPAATATLREETIRYLTRAFSNLVRIPESRIQPADPFEKFGVDSIMVMEFTQKLEKDFGDLSKTLLFEHRNLDELAGYFLSSHPGRLEELLGANKEEALRDAEAMSAPEFGLAGDFGLASEAGPGVPASMEPSRAEPGDIAIIGVFGRYPMADDLEEFWANLRNGRDCIVEIPADRWDYRLFYDPEPGKPGKTRNKWGGFLNDIGRFDAQFFSITPREAFALDPQERLFLESAWRTVEDAGYRKSVLAGKKVGVFVGVMYGEYQLYGAGDIESGAVFPLSSSYASIANRVSYFFDWRGPSMAIDTMCSSSLTAIHLACESLRRGESELALAGGVNLTVHPHKDALLSPGGFAASDGRCRSFGEGGDGYVPGEGVGAVLLKPLPRAIVDRDHIYGLVRGSSLNHGGKTNGYTVPSPNAQAELIIESLAAAHIDPRTVNYIEAHGTGTALGDPIEIAGLNKAFNDGSGLPLKSHRCAIGSVKSNIGHLESAAGIAGVTKVLLQMQHGEIAPSLHSVRLNPNIRFTESIFHVPQTVEAWSPLGSVNHRLVRRAGISSFGAGGANAHTIIEEYLEESIDVADARGPFLLVLSAKNEDRLRAIAERLAKYLVSVDRNKVRLRDVVYTLQVGREPLDERLAIAANDFADASAQLTSFLSGSLSVRICRGSAREHGLTPLLDGEEGQAFIEALVQQRKWLKLGQFWVTGGLVPWERLYEGVAVRRIPLPTYPFSGERYWAPEKLKALAKPTTNATRANIPQPQGVDVSLNPQNSTRVESPEIVFLRPVWQRRPKTGTTQLPARATLLLFDHTADLHAAIRLKYPGWSITRVVPGANYERNGELVTIDPSSGDHFRRLVGEIKADFIIHRWAGSQGTLQDHLQAGVFPLFHLCKALIDPAPTSVIKLLVCRDTDAGPASNALIGFAQAIAQEQPQIQIRILQSSDATGVHLLDELLGAEDTRHIRLEKGDREIRMLEPFEPVSDAPLPFRRWGIYLITGGLGAVGEIFARWLAKQFAARLVLMGRSPLGDRSRSAILELEALGAEVEYVQADSGSEADVTRAIRVGKERFGELNGIIHAAGVVRDGFLLKKSLADFEDVIRSKVFGTVLLDEATKQEQLDFFVLFSSTAGVFGNAGQVDYSYANAFLDAFASAREGQRERGERYGQTVSINWPLWKETGMAARAPHALKRLEQAGLCALPEDTGVEIFVAALRASEPQVLPLYGLRQKINRLLATDRDDREINLPTAGTQVGGRELVEKTEAYLKSIFSEVTQLPVPQLDSDQRFEEFGVDSIVVSDFNLRIERDLGPLPKTLLFEHANFRQLTGHLVEAFKPQLSRFLQMDAACDVGDVSQTQSQDSEESSVSDFGVNRVSGSSVDEDIAIIGLAGRYPKAEDIQTFWQILRAGTDCVTEIPDSRWDIDRCFDPDPEKAALGKMYSRWGAFLDDVDKFDSLFFNIAPLEAQLIDPQERLFLETAWCVLEDAGYTRRDLSRCVRREYAANVGVFVGVTSNSYAAVAQECGHGRAIPTTMPWSIANRVSYLFNFNGPSIPIDTACSSSLTAIHLACESIHRGECQQAIAGGVNLYLHPSRYVGLCLTRMLSTDGKCRAFGEGGNGFVPGEGVGAVLLKPLSLALAAGDHIYGVIKGTAVNHGGRTNGFTVPNPIAQADLIKRAWRQGKIDPRTVTYLEAHGTGTALGDPIELAGLMKAFIGSDDQPDSAFCALGSVKSNIGHLESAAGIAGLTKVLLQFKARELVPTLYCEKVNPNIELAGTPFRLQKNLGPWSVSATNQPQPLRRAGISSFGAGGANAHIVLEEYVPPARARGAENKAPLLIVLSARTEGSLYQFAARLSRFLSESTEEETPLPSVAYTLQVGRESFEERAAFCVAGRDELIANLRRIGAGDLADAIRGRVRRERVQIAAEVGETESDPDVADAIRRGDLDALARLWVAGVTIDWEPVWGQNSTARRISLPTYAFRRERHWIETATESNPSGTEEKRAEHPLVDWHESIPDGWRYHRSFDANEIVLRDHQIAGRKVLPGAVSLELAMFAASEVLASSQVRLHNIVWLVPLTAVADRVPVRLTVTHDGSDRISFQLTDADDRMVMQGKAERISSPNVQQFNLEEVRTRCGASISADELYQAFASRQLEYGPGFRVLQEIRYGGEEVLARLRVPTAWSEGSYRLHPALIDGALQGLAVLGSRGAEVEVPFALETLECGSPLPQHCYAYGRIESDGGNIRRFQIRLVGMDGAVLARINGLAMRRSELQRNDVIVCRPVWVPEPMELQSAFAGKILLFDDQTDFGLRLEEKGSSVIQVPFAEQLPRNGHVVQLRHGEQEDYDRLVQNHDFDAILHAWSQHISSLEEAIERGLLSVHRLAKALVRSGKAVPWLFVCPENEPVYEAVAGYAKTLRQEHPKLHLKTVAVSDRSAFDPVAELTDLSFEVRYRYGQREVRKLEQLQVPPTLPELGLKERGVYLITGGGGALGRIFAKHWLEKFDARLVLVGRSELQPGWQQEFGENAIYVEADISTPEGVTRAVSEAKHRFGGLQGIIHAAGATRDQLIRNKSEENILQVLRAKVWGAELLDQITCDEPLDLFVLFSSTAGLLGNAGQADYAYANAYLDAFAWRREQLRQTGQRSGQTLSINWPLWRDGGLQPGEAAAKLQANLLSLWPLETVEGLSIFDQLIKTGEVQCAVLSGSPHRLITRLNAKANDDRETNNQNAAGAFSRSIASDAQAPEGVLNKADLLEELRQLVAKVLRLDPTIIENDADTSEYGFDSVTFTTLANEINQALGLEITPAVLFEYTTLDAFADFLGREYGSKLKARLGSSSLGTVEEVGQRQRSRLDQVSEPDREHRVAVSDDWQNVPSPEPATQSIAIVGMSGIFPGSPNLQAFWENLEAGLDLISKPAPERWSFPAAPEGTGSSSTEPPWGGFMPGVDQFDSLFFDISPREAELMDPQQRLFLQTVWHALEDAGYRKSDLAGSKTGLFVGVAANDYANLLAMSGVPVEAYSSTGNAHSVLANRVSFFFDWQGPSEAIDTACSSSLVALHRAIESMASGSCDLAFVGGVNVLLSPAAFQAFSKAGMLSADGRCKTFDFRANGYVRGEGVGAILLKPLKKALQDRDHVYAIIRGSAENHGGRAQGLTVPNPNAQARLLLDAYSRAHIDPSTIGYIEAHGTGTSLGDPIEVNGLKKAFAESAGEVREPRCAVGSVKANIGHLETAAGIAGIIKVLLAMQHRRIPGNIHLNQLNPYIQVEGTAFYFPEKSVPWQPMIDQANRELPRRAGVSSFGFGGANAHVLLEEFSAQPLEERGSGEHEQPELFIFAARGRARLTELVSNFIAYLRSLDSRESGFPKPSIRQIAFTLQVGREPLNERLAVIASDFEHLTEQLEEFKNGALAEVFAGNVDDGKNSLRLLREVHQDDSFLEPLLSGRDLVKLARLWVGGLNVPWEKLWTSGEVSRVPLPGYPFEPQRFWVPKATSVFQAAASDTHRLHPLLHRNESTLKSQMYRSEFDGEEVFFRDHRVAGQKVFPGAASLELALAGASLALESPNVIIRQIVWARPILGGSENLALKLQLFSEPNGGARFELGTSDSERAVFGKVALVQPEFEPIVDLSAIRSKCNQDISVAKLYETFRECGLEYGPGFRAIQQIQRSDSEVLSVLEIPANWGDKSFRLHPALLDGAFQSLATIRGSSEEGVELPFTVEEVICPESLPSRCLAFGRLTSRRNGERKYDILLLNDEGRVLASVAGLSCRRLAAGGTDPFYYQARWQDTVLTGLPGDSVRGAWLVFDRGNELAAALSQKGLTTVRVIDGESYQHLGNTVRIARDQGAEYARLVQEVDFTGVIHRWSKPPSTPDEAQACGVFSIHLLVQALLKAKKKRPIAFIYPAGEPAFEAVNGYAKTLRHEHPDLRLKTIGVDTDFSSLTSELENADLEVRYLNGRRQVRTLETALVTPTNWSGLRRGGVYLISGGAGGLGRIFARYLVERYDARVVLVGRSNETETIAQALQSLGKNAAYFSVDISTLEGARQAVDYTKHRYGTINGVLHAAGVLRDGLIRAKTLEDFRAVLAPKVAGAEALDSATDTDQLDWFVLFSSMAGLLGNAGQSDYAYANAYLDSFAHRREELRKQGMRSGRTLSINWPLWREGGMRRNSGADPAAALGLQLLEWEQGCEIFERALAADLLQVWAGIGDAEKIRRRLLRRSDEQPEQPTSKKAIAPSSKGEEELEAYLTSRFAGLLKLDPTQVKPWESLESYGFDSIVAVEFSQLLEKDFGELSKTLLFEYPTIASLAAYLAGRVQNRRNPKPQENSKSDLIGHGNETEVLVAATNSNGETMRRLELAPTDYPFIGPRRLAIQVLYHFENRLEFTRLEVGLQEVAKRFYPINSKLVADGDRAYIITETSDPPDFAEIVCKRGVALPWQDEPTSFEPFQVSFNPLAPGEKLAKFRLFQLASGSLLSVNVSHAIADGYSYYYFLSAWAAACRLEAFQAPSHARAVLRKLADAYREKHGDELSSDQLEAGSIDADFDPTTERMETLHVDPKSLFAQVRESANAETRGWLTENSVITAFVWQTYARSLGEVGELTLACPIDFRPMLPELSMAFFGNASAPALMRLPCEQVANASIDQLAMRISDSVRRCDAETLIRYSAAMDQLRVRHGLAAVDRMALVDPRSGLIVTNVARFPLPPIDFGTGPFTREFTPTNYAGTGVIVSEGNAIKVRLAYPKPIVHPPQ